MSKTCWNEDGTKSDRILVDDITKCKWLCDEVCCNDKSECLGDYPEHKCESENECELFERENGVALR